MKIKMKLLSDTIFGNGESIPGGEDIALLCDNNGFPYYRGGSFKGVFREELLNYLTWSGEENPEKIANRLLGNPGGDDDSDDGKLIFSDFVIPEGIKSVMYEEAQSYYTKLAGKTGSDYDPAILVYDAVLNSFSHIRTFTAIDETGTAKENSLRSARCVNEGLIFESEIICSEEDAGIVKEVLPMVKWIGSMRNRGFGKIELTVD